VESHRHEEGIALTPFLFSNKEWEALTGLDISMPFIPIGDLYYGPTGAHLNVSTAQGIRKVRPSRQICGMPLAPISRHRLDVAKLKALAVTSPEAEEWWRWLEGDHISRHLDRAPPLKAGCSRRFSARDISDAERCRVLARGRVTWSHPVFKVPKGEGQARLILDCRTLNAALPKPGNMGLPLIHDVYDTLLRCRFIAQIDARSYFYQFELDPKAQAMFGCNLVAKRGLKLQRRFTVLPMGFKFAPGIAQHTSLHLLRNMTWTGVKTAWVDNFLFGAESMEDLEQGLTEFQALCSHVGLDVKPPERGQRLKVLGALIDVQTKTVRATEEAQRALQEARMDLKKPTPRKVFRFMGTALWQLVAICRTPLCMVEAAIEIMRRVLPEYGKWDTPCTLTREDMDALENVVSFTRNPYTSRQEANHTHLWWSDASDAHIGWAWNEADLSMGATDVHGIFARELLAGATALLNADKNAQSARLCIDNKAAERALIRGLSSSKAGNIILRKLYDANLKQSHEVMWVSTDIQRADNPSRGLMIATPALNPQNPVSRLRWASRKGGSLGIHS
jgi:hypothetical protein